jgi:hypothetical protein
MRRHADTDARTYAGSHADTYTGSDTDAHAGPDARTDADSHAGRLQRLCSRTLRRSDQARLHRLLSVVE